MLRLALFAVVLAACTDVPAITSGVCGNHVLDPGEDCDQATGCTASCRIACDPDQATTCTAGFDGVCCPTGFACGTDGACRAPGGKLSASDITEPFEALEFTVADIDHDHIADILGVSSGAVEARYGSSTAPLAASAIRDAPFANGLPALGDYTGDGEPDVLIPTAGGLFGFETASGAPEPIAFPHELDPAVAHFRIASVGGSDLLQVDAVVPPGDTRPTLVVSRNGMNAQRPCLAMGDVDPGLLRGRGIHPWDDSLAQDHSRELLPLAFLGPTMTEATLCIHELTSAGVNRLGGFIDLGPIVTAIPADGETFYADLDQNASTCPDLLVPALGPGGKEMTLLVPGIGSQGACTIAMDPLRMDHVKYTDDFVDGLPLGVLRVKTAAGVQVAIVTSVGIYSLDATGRNPTPIAAATRSWRFVAIGDFDHDGYDDIATGATSEDAEILLQVPASSTTPVTFRQLRIVTGGGVAQLATGDFDGDGIDDVALATVDLANDRTAQLEVAYGGPLLGVLPPVTGPSFPEFDAFTVAQLDDPAVPPGYDHSDDLIAAYGDDDLTGSGKLADIFGSSTQTLTAPFLFSSNFGTTTGPQVPGLGVLAAIGHYGSQQGLGVLALFTHRSIQTGTGTLASYDWTQFGWTDDGTFSELTADRAFDPAFSPEQAAFTNLTVKDGELLIGFVDIGTTCKAGYYLSGSTPSLMLTTPDCSTVAPGADATAIASLGQANSISAYPPSDASSDGTLIVRRLAVAGRSYALHRWNLHVTGGVPTLSDPIDYTAEIGADGCMDAAPIELGGADAGFGDGPEWLVACRMSVGMGRFSTQIFAGYVDAGGQRHYTLLFDTGADVVATVRAGDVDGDGVQDVIYVAGPPGFGSVHVRLQCDSHGVCQGGS